MENKNKIIIIVLIVVIAALLVGIFAMLPNLNKEATTLTFNGNATLTEGDSLKILLTDENGTGLANQNVNVTLTDDDNSNSYYSVVTNEKGIGSLKLDKGAGKYKSTVIYQGDDTHKSCNASKTITVKDKVIESEMESSSTSTNSDPGAFYSAQAGRVIYTGEVQNAPDGGRYKHLGYNQWVPVD